MICGPNFPGDDDQRLFKMQHEAYSEALWTIVEATRKRYLDAECILRCYASMSIQVRQLCSIDHRTVQDIHDLIAAWYRFKRRTERLFPLEADLVDEWYSFLWKETRELCGSADFVTGLLDACIYANAESGYAGEERARRIQRRRYSEMLRYTLPHLQAEEDPDVAR